MSISTEGEIQVFTRREFVGDIRSSSTIGGFKFNRIPANPNSSTFPFLSQLATSYEHYQFASLSFYWRPITNENSTTAQMSLGTVTMYFCYDALEPIVLSRNEANNYQGARTARICDPLTLTVKPPKHPMFLRSPGSQSIDTDIRESDFGYLALVTENINDPTVPIDKVVGELYVTYKVAFWKPKVQDFIGAAVLMSNLVGPVQLTGTDGTNITGAAGTTFGVLPVQRNFLIDNFGMKGAVIPNTAPFGNVFSIPMRRGQVIEIEILIGISSGTFATGIYPFLVPQPSGSNVGTGTAVLTGYYPVIDATGTIISYSNTEIQATNATNTSSCAAQYVAKCTKDGIVNFVCTAPGFVTHGGAGGAGTFHLRVTLLNRPDYGLQLPVTQRPPNWLSPDN